MRRVPSPLVLLVGLGLGIATLTATTAAATTQGSTDEEPSALASDPITVAIKEAAPFVMLDSEEPRGYSIEFWEEVAERTGLDYTYVTVESVTDQLEAVESGDADAAIAAISVTTDREQTVDFTHPIYVSGQQVLVDSDDGVGATGLFGHLIDSGLIKLIVLLLGVTVGMGVILWLIERRKNPHFGGDESDGALDGIWWSVVTLTTVGYGDKVPTSKAGRILSMVWILFGVVFLALFTAAVTTSLTIEELGTEIDTVEDLYGKDVLAIEGTTSESTLQARHIAYTTSPDVDTAARSVAEGRADALVYDAPLLQYYAATDGRGAVQTVGEVFDPEWYAIALPQGSDLEEPLNVALAAIAEDGTGRAIADRWFDDGG